MGQLCAFIGLGLDTLYRDSHFELWRNTKIRLITQHHICDGCKNPAAKASWYSISMKWVYQYAAKVYCVRV